MKPYLSLVIPCYNEAKSLPALVARCTEALAGREAELVLVDNGSVDASPEVLADLLDGHPFARSVRVPVNQGYGYGILFGLRRAEGRILAWTHADLQTDPADVPEGLKFFREAADPDRVFVKGRRRGRPLGDAVFTWGMAAFESALLGSPLWDINAQPTMFGRGFFEGWADPPSDFSLDLYAYHRAVRGGLDVRRVPVTFGPRVHGVSHWNVDWRGKARFIRRTLDYSLRLRREIGRR